MVERALTYAGKRRKRGGFNIASLLPLLVGLGRRKKTKKRGRGGLGSAIGSLADQLFGLGKRRRKRTHRKKRGKGLGSSIGLIADHLFGLGKRRKRTHRKKRGGGVLDFLKKAHDKIKSGSYISKGADAAAKYGPKVRDIAKILGYGRKRRRGGNRIGQVIMQ